jgi:hypothetical protein
VKIPRTAIWLIVLAILLAWIAAIFIEDPHAGSIALIFVVLGGLLASVIVAGSHHNQRLERLGREADAQNRPPGSKGGAS